MQNKELQVFISAAFAGLLYYLGIVSIPIIVLMVMMIIDYLSGMSAAWVHGDLSSKIGAFTDKNSNTYVGYTATTSYNAATTRNFATNTQLYDLSDNSQGKTIAKRLPYVHDGSSVNIAKIDGKVILSGTQRAADIDGVLDCSTITGDMLYPSGSKTYYAVDDNTLVEI